MAKNNMGGMMNIISLTIILWVGILVSQVFALQTINDPEGNFTIHIPDDWEPIPIKELNQRDENLKKLKPLNPNKIHPIILMGFKLKGERGYLYPNIIIDEKYVQIRKRHVEKYQKGDLGLYKKELNRRWSGLGEIENMTDYIYDQKQNMFWLFLRIYNELENYYLLTVGGFVPTLKGVLLVTCHLKEEDKIKYYKTCIDIVKSFKVSEKFGIRF